MMTKEKTQNCENKGRERFHLACIDFFVCELSQENSNSTVI